MGTVLVVDDNAANRELLQRQLALDGFSVIVAEDVSRGLEFARQIDEDLSASTYRLMLDKGGRIEWRHEGGSELATLNREPDTGLWRRFKAAIYRLLPIEDQL